jgi:DNA-binding NtrC family response regulator
MRNRHNNAAESNWREPGPWVLVVDDDENIRRLVSCALTGAGFKVNAAANGEDAWEELRRKQYDLLVTDNEMPRLSGLELIARIRSRGMSLSVIMASGTCPVESVGNDAQLRLTAVLPKPFKIGELLDAVRQALRPTDENSAPCGGNTRSQITSPEAKI